MSHRNGDRARHDRANRRKLVRREKMRLVRKEMTPAEAADKAKA